MMDQGEKKVLDKYIDMILTDKSEKKLYKIDALISNIDVCLIN